MLRCIYELRCIILVNNVIHKDNTCLKSNDAYHIMVYILFVMIYEKICFNNDYVL